LLLGGSRHFFMNLALFGGTFDPIHRGHLKIARAAAQRFALKQVWFVPAYLQPLKSKEPITSYFHRFAMTVLGVAGEKDFVPSLLEAPNLDDAAAERRPSYSIDTVRRARKLLGKSDRLFFLIGIDAFKTIAKWREAEALFQECEFIVAARPGFSLADIALALPETLQPSPAVTRLFRHQKMEGPLVLPDACLHLLPETQENISATQIRAAVERGAALKKLVPDAVAEYIHKQHLYKPTKPRRRNTEPTA
jgi:nicotinate-nucleotide adenylyltransferase